MAMVAHKTDYVVTFWVPLPYPLGVADNTELELKHKEMFPENQPGFFVPDHPDGPQYIDQSWVIHQRMNIPIPSGVDFAESLMRSRLEQDLELDDYQLDMPGVMKQLGIHQQTVVETICAIKGPEHDFVVARLNEVVAAIAEFHVRLNSLQGVPASRFSSRSVDPVPFMVRSVEESSDVHYGLTSPGEVTKYSSALNIPEATDEEIVYASQLSKDEPFRPALILENEARNAYAVGSNILAAICFGAAAEAFLTELCQFISWEAEVPTKEVAKALSGQGGVSNRCLQLLGKQLKGNWDRNNNPVLKAWQADVVTLRNQAAHNGHEPTDVDIDQAQASFYELKAFLRQKLLDQMTRFPYVTAYYIGQPTLRELELFERWEKIIDEYSLTPDPEGSFFRYKTEVRFLGDKKFDFSRLEGSNILQIIDSNAEKTWVQLDDATLLARKIADPQPSEWYELQHIRLRNANGDYTETLTDLDTSVVMPLGEWEPASYIIPSLSTKRSEQYEVLEYDLSPPSRYK